MAFSTLYNAITPLLLLDTVAIPLAKVTVVAVPKLTAVPFLSIIVGTVPFGAVVAPEKVKDLSPV
jgi:hypothetical protein